MRKLLILALLAATAATPALAQGEPRHGRSVLEAQTERPHRERGEARPMRQRTQAPAQTIPERRWNNTTPSQARPEFRRERREDRQEFRRDRQSDNRDFRQERREDGRDFRRDRRDDQRDWRNDRNDHRWTGNDRREDRRDWRTERREDGRDFRRDRREDQRDWRNDRNDRRWTGNDRRWTGNDNRWDGNDRRWDRGDNRWNRDWRNDRRYDWQRYRSQYRHIYRPGRYHTPYGWNYGYRRYSIGIYLDSLLFGSSYWLNDPWQYRLPPAHGPYRWVRYYDDVLLIDIRSGYVVDVIHDFFY